MHTWTTWATCINSAQLRWRHVACTIGPKSWDFLRELGKRLIKDGDRGTMIICFPNAENFRCDSNWECNMINCIPPCQCNN